MISLAMMKTAGNDVELLHESQFRSAASGFSQ